MGRRVSDDRALSDSPMIFTDSGIPASAVNFTNGSVPLAAVSGTPISVLDKGAKGDGATDDTAAFNNAITAAGIYGAVLVPAPSVNYRIAGTINNPNSIPLLIFGQGLFSGSGAPTSNIIRLGIGSAFQLYVSSSGSDSNPGTSALPFLTIQQAVNVAAQFAGAGVGVTINVASGSYAGVIYASNGLSFNGSGINQQPPGITINGGWGGGTTTITKSPLAPACIGVNGWGAAISLTGNLTFTSTGHGLFAYAGGVIYLSSSGTLTFGACTNAHMHADSHGQINIGCNYTISGGGTAHLECSLRAFIGYYEVNHTVTLTGSPVFSIAFAHAQATSVIYVPAGNITFSGAAGATTIRFYAHTGAIIETNIGSATYLPGTATGQTASNGRYGPLPLPSVTGLSGFGAGASAVAIAGSTDQEGLIAITTGTGPGTSGSFTINTSTTGPNSLGAVAFNLNPGGGTWNARAAIQTGGGTTATSVGVTIDNNAVAFPASTTLYVHYMIRPF